MLFTDNFSSAHPAFLINEAFSLFAASKLYLSTNTQTHTDLHLNATAALCFLFNTSLSAFALKRGVKSPLAKVVARCQLLLWLFITLGFITLPDTNPTLSATSVTMLLATFTSGFLKPDKLITNFDKRLNLGFVINLIFSVVQLYLALSTPDYMLKYYKITTANSPLAIYLPRILASFAVFNVTLSGYALKKGAGSELSSVIARCQASFWALYALLHIIHPISNVSKQYIQIAAFMTFASMLNIIRLPASWAQEQHSKAN